MKQSEIFKSAKWIGLGEECLGDGFAVIRGHFFLEKAKSAVLYVIGLGFFHCYINGKRVGEDLFLPLTSDYNERKDRPIGEVMTGHRIYVPKYDISDMVKEGENTIAIHFGGGWYTYKNERYGKAKAIWRIFGEDIHGAFDFFSSENDKIAKSYITDYGFTTHEEQDLNLIPDSILNDSLDSKLFENAKEMKDIESEYLFSSCPADRVCERLCAVCIKQNGKYAVYDIGKNISGYPMITVSGKKGERVDIVFSECLDENSDPHPEFNHGQKFSIISNGEKKTVSPLFTWFGFRYFSVLGDAQVQYAEFIHTDIKKVSHFECDNKVLNWIHEAYITTQSSNMHGGIPSDCPHLERRGYTGDGQLTCHAAMNIFDAKEFYRKWIEDISDCQDKLSGHVQYTAPYTHSGGGPGGWGCAIVEVPYQYYLHYGDTEPLFRLYPQMLKYFDYLEEHSKNGLVVSDKAGEWCLGDWCPPIQVILPAPFVNNYFYIKSLAEVIEIAKLTGNEKDIPMLQSRIAERKEAIMTCYFNPWDGNFLGGMQGANAFALDIGLGDERTYNIMLDRYKKSGAYDTGIFGTDILTRVLFEKGDGELAAQLLTSDSIHSFKRMKDEGATSLWEYWPCSLQDRSKNHPMFGAVVAYFYDYLLGIRAKKGAPAYNEIVVSPVLVSEINTLSGHRRLPSGDVFVSYKKGNGSIAFDIDLPKDQKAEFVYKDKAYPLSCGKNKFVFEI